MSGLMPSTQWEMKNFHQKYYAGNTISVGIGQGETQVTPIQLAARAERAWRPMDTWSGRTRSVPTSCRRTSGRR